MSSVPFVGPDSWSLTLKGCHTLDNYGRVKLDRRGQTTFSETHCALSPLSCMPRRARFVLPGVPHHVTQRGNNRQDVFFSDQDRIHYIQMLRAHSHRHDLRILGWCLMSNHVHLIVIPGNSGSLALALGQAHSQYSLEYNRLDGRVGHLWQNRFFSCPLEPSHLVSAMRYVELNPVRAKMTTEAWDWRWSSARAHTSLQAHDELLDWPWRDWMEEARLGAWNYADWKASLLAGGPAEELDRMRRAIKLGEPFGSDEFVRDLEAKAGRRLRVWERGRPPKKKVTVATGGQQTLFADG
jgi:putative transposase